jgi:hypothetical protein
MRAVWLFVSLAFSAVSMAYPDPPQCKGLGLRPGAFSDQEWQAVAKEPQSGDPVITEAGYLMSEPVASISAYEQHHALSIPWPKAKRLILMGAITRMYTKYAEEGLYLGSRSRKTYFTKVLKPDSLFDLLSRIDPCHMFISIEEP